MQTEDKKQMTQKEVKVKDETVYENVIIHWNT